MERMRTGWQIILGVAALLSLVALLSPGVRAVRADTDAEAARFERFAEFDARQPTPAAAESCEANQSDRGFSDAVAEIQREIGKHEANRRPGDPILQRDGDTVVLNNRGYNYGAPR